MKKKLLTAIVAICLVSSVAFAFAKDPVKCTMKKDTVFVMVNVYYGAVAVITAEDTKITILRIEKHQDKEVVIFSLSYDKPSIVCERHRKDTFDLYKSFLKMDEGFVLKERLEDCK